MTYWRQHRLKLALLISLLLHLTLVGAPGWLVPTLDDLLHSNPSPQLEAHLVSVPTISAPAPQPAKPLKSPIPHRTVAPRVIAMQHGESATPLPAVQQDSAPAPAEAAPSETASSAAPPAPKLPRHGNIRFAVSRGDQNFVIGQSLHRWRHDGKAYTLSSVTETTGIAAMIRPARVVQTSEGEVGLDGLRPREFRTEKNGIAGDTASFDWTQMKLVLSGGAQHEIRLMTGTQDMLSLFYQLSAVFPWVPHDISEIMIATGRKFERYAFKVLGEEKLPTKFGALRVLHLRTEGDGGEAIDIWVGLELQGLPLKIRYADRQGETFDQNAEDIEYDGMPIPFTSH